MGHMMAGTPVQLDLEAMHSAEAEVCLLVRQGRLPSPAATAVASEIEAIIGALESPRD